jgi:thiol-disulfide isomerase/thioredoxin
MKNKLAITSVLVVLLLALGFLYFKYRVPPSINFKALQLTDLDNKPLDFNMLKGKTVFVNFFATWCGPCVEELPELERAQDNLKNSNFIFVCISDEAVNRLQNFARRMHSGLMILHSVKNLHEYNVYTFPTSYVINTSGDVVYTKVGESDWDSETSLAELKKLAR